VRLIHDVRAALARLAAAVPRVEPDMLAAEVNRAGIWIARNDVLRAARITGNESLAEHAREIAAAGVAFEAGDFTGAAGRLIGVADALGAALAALTAPQG
jgi:hypothetical protein